MFNYEADMQDWLKRELEIKTLNCLIHNVDVGVTIPPEAPDYYYKIKDTYSSAARSFGDHEIVSLDSNILGDQRAGLYPDLFLYSIETYALVVIELKNSSNATRQTGTELSAYTNGIHCMLPKFSEVIKVIVSSHWPTLLCNQVAYDILVNKEKIVCLKPVNIDGQIKLEFFIPSSEYFSKPVILTNWDTLHGVHLEFEDHEWCRRGRLGGLGKYLPQINAFIRNYVMQRTQSKGHGFAFLWKHKQDDSCSPYVATFVELSPFGSLNNICSNRDDKVSRKIRQINHDYEPRHGAWVEDLYREAKKHVGKICFPLASNFNTWQALEKSMLNECHIILEFYAWGDFHDYYQQLLSEKYSKGEIINFGDPDSGLELLRKITKNGHEMYFEEDDFLMDIKY